MKSKKYYEVRESIVASCYRLEIGGFQVCNNKTREKRFFARNDMDEFKIWYQEQLEEGTKMKIIFSFAFAIFDAKVKMLILTHYGPIL